MGEGKVAVPQRVTSCRINAGKDKTALASGLSVRSTAEEDGCTCSHTVCDKAENRHQYLLPHMDGSVSPRGCLLV